MNFYLFIYSLMLVSHPSIKVGIDGSKKYYFNSSYTKDFHNKVCDSLNSNQWQHAHQVMR